MRLKLTNLESGAAVRLEDRSTHGDGWAFALALHVIERHEPSPSGSEVVGALARCGVWEGARYRLEDLGWRAPT